MVPGDTAHTQAHLGSSLGSSSVGMGKGVHGEGAGGSWEGG